MQTPIGYIVTILIQSVGSFVIISGLLCTVLFPVAHCVFIITFCSDLESELFVLNEIIQNECEKKSPFSTNAIIKIRGKLCKIIRFYCDAKQLSVAMFPTTQ